jgi:hypothetical protein
MSTDAGSDREARRQRQLLRALWRRDADDALTPWMPHDAASTRLGLAAYRGNSAAIAARALGAAFPTVRELMSNESFDSLARTLWHRHPPERGDLAHWGGTLAAFIDADTQLADEAYLADVARLDWAVHRIEHAADGPSLPDGLARLASEDPARLGITFRDGATRLPSRWPIVSIWRAHRRSGDDRFASVRAAFANGRAECAWVWRDGWRAAVSALDAPDARFVGALQRGESLAAALECAGAAFAFEAWLREAVTQRWLAAVRFLPDAPTEAGH